MQTYYLNKQQKQILLNAHSFLVRSGSFHLGNSVLKIIRQGFIKDAITFYTVRALLYSIIPTFQVEKLFTITKEVKK